MKNLHLFEIWLIMLVVTVLGKYQVEGANNTTMSLGTTTYWNTTLLTKPITTAKMPNTTEKIPASVTTRPTIAATIPTTRGTNRTTSMDQSPQGSGPNVTNETHVGSECCKLSTTSQCSEKGGKCIPNNETCNGDEYAGSQYCLISNLKSCKCCVLQGECACGQDVNGGCSGYEYIGHPPRLHFFNGQCMKNCTEDRFPLLPNKCPETGGKDCQCCGSTKCTPENCNHKNQTGRCSWEPIPHYDNVGRQQCTGGCNCYIRDTECSPSCNAKASCILPEYCGATYCKCNVGYAGDGLECGTDTDLDGFPDEELSCCGGNVTAGTSRCCKDNCPLTPNSGQEDADDNGIGDACDNSTESLIRPMSPFMIRSCTITNTTNCDKDIDQDGIEYNVDNCPSVNNPNQTDSDGDSIGDVCDNCPSSNNTDQADTDQDKVGDACDNDIDEDKDGIQDDIDNCPLKSNAEQLDSDGDGVGNACDDDADGDGVPNDQDNCWLVPNTNQSSQDTCLNDFDGDGINNCDDNCPNNYLIGTTNFSIFDVVNLDPVGTSQVDPVWIIQNSGAEVKQSQNSNPGLLVGQDAVEGIDYEGTFYIGDASDDDFAGFIFSYQSNARFYVVGWKKVTQEYWDKNPFIALGEAGITLKKVASKTGPGIDLRNALWHSGTVDNQTELLWQDPAKAAWKHGVSYHWQLLHRPEIGLIRFRILDLTGALIVDSDNIFDEELNGGRLGLFVFSQENVIFSNLEYRCNGDVPQDIYDNLPSRLQALVDIDHSWHWW